MWAFVFVVSAVAASPEEALTDAEHALSVLNYRAAESALAIADKGQDLTRQQVLLLHELKARVAAGRGRSDEARREFQLLLELDPDFRLAGKASPKLTGPFFEARGAVTKTGPLTVGVRREDGALVVNLAGPLQRVARVALVLDEAGERRELSLTPSQLAVPLSVKPGRLVSQVVLKSSQGWELLVVNTTFEAPPAAVTVLEPTAAASPPPAPPLVVSSEAAPAPRVRWPAWVTLGAGVVALGVGTAFFVSGASARDQFNRAVAGAQDGVLPLTRDQAEALDAQVRAGQLGSLVGWIGGGALSALGLLLALVNAGGGA